jgi:hypothetical protein
MCSPGHVVDSEAAVVPNSTQTPSNVLNTSQKLIVRVLCTPMGVLVFPLRVNP